MQNHLTVAAVFWESDIDRSPWERLEGRFRFSNAKKTRGFPLHKIQFLSFLDKGFLFPVGTEVWEKPCPLTDFGAAT